ncbi:MAG: Serine/threonine-protein kinase PknD [Planctomycetes bacterium]|nr:Serine/threonine-protein kinase PknD [Planctomycetota bacterium]
MKRSGGTSAFGDRMSDERRDLLLARAVEAAERHRTSGGAAPDEHPSVLGAPDEVLTDLAEILEVEAAIDHVIEPRTGARLPRRLGGWTLVAEAGRGAAGVVYEAIRRSDRRRVALKVLRAGVEHDAVARERFRREATACASVRHPNLVGFVEAGEADGLSCVAMDFVEGTTLRAAARARTLPGPADLVRRFAEVADALDALHRAGIVHRDVKPSNLVVAADGRFVLMDLGLAHLADADRLTQPGDVVGTPLYMAPERLRGAGEADARSDVWGLGATIWETVAGRPLFDATDFASLRRRLLTEDPPTLDAVAPQFPAAFRAAVMKSLARAPEARHPTAAAFRDAMLG